MSGVSRCGKSVGELRPSIINRGELYDDMPDYVHILNQNPCNKSVLDRAGLAAIARQILWSLVKKCGFITYIPYFFSVLFHQLRIRRLDFSKLFWMLLARNAKRFDEEYDLAVAFIEGAATYYVSRYVKAKKKATYVHIDYWAVSMMESGSKSDDSEKAAQEQTSVQEEKSEDQQEQGPGLIEKTGKSFRNTVKQYTDFWGYVVYICAGISVVFGAVVLFFTSKKKQGRVALGLGLHMLFFNFVFMNAGLFGLPSLIASDRAVNYLIYLGATVIGVPFGLFWCLFEEKIKPVRWVASVAIVVATAMVIVFGGYTYTSSAVFRLSYSAVTENYYKIKATHRKDTWTIVSTVDELSLTRNKGWHYELWEFIFRMEQYDSTRVIQIPTEYVYFVIEKRPLKYAEPTYLGQSLTLYPRISKEAANQLLSEQTIRTRKKSDYYGIYENRHAIMSKAYFWAEKYMSYFPDQMSIYYEDMDIVIYEIKQNMYALNNFAIDYGYNTITMEQWLMSCSLRPPSA